MFTRAEVSWLDNLFDCFATGDRQVSDEVSQVVSRGLKILSNFCYCENRKADFQNLPENIVS